MTFRSERDLDDLDWSILEELQADGRLSYKELGRRVNLSSPAVAERVRRLEESGVITGYRAQVDPGPAGYPISAIVDMRSSLGHCLLTTGTAEVHPDVVEVHTPSGGPRSESRVSA